MVNFGESQQNISPGEGTLNILLSQFSPGEDGGGEHPYINPIYISIYIYIAFFTGAKITISVESDQCVGCPWVITCGIIDDVN